MAAKNNSATSFMTIKKYIRLISVLVATLAGCQTSDSPKSLSSLTHKLPDSQSKASNYSIPSNANVEQLVSQALSHHPSLTAAQHKINRLQAKVPQQRALPDPRARISAGNLA